MRMAQRYRSLVTLNDRPGRWHKESTYKEGFYARRYPLSDRELVGMLRGDYWLATRAPEDGVVDRILLDVDCPSDADIPRRDENYARIRKVFGEENVPMVFATPSGTGLRVAYRIPRTPLTSLASGVSTGLVPEVLAGAGIVVRQGNVEVYPQRRRIDRLVLGPRMPFLDPESLTPLGDPGRDREAVVSDGLGRLADWHSRVLPGLLPLLQRRPRTRQSIADPELGFEQVVELDPFSDTDAAIRTASRLVTVGLERPSSRFDAEFMVAVAFALNRGGNPAFGLPAKADREEIAWAVARWLSQMNNGYSEEWNRSLVRGEDHAVARWAARYLHRSATDGTNMIDRAVRVARALARRSLGAQIGLDDRLRIMGVADDLFEPGAQRYRFEVWGCAFMRAIGSILAYRATTAEPPEIETRSDTDWAIIEIAARWMEQWPYGGGSDRTGRRRYVIHREALMTAGLLERVTPYVHQAYRYQNRGRPSPEVLPPNRATGYRVPVPVGAPQAVPAQPEAVRSVCRHLRRHGKQLSVDEVYHALYLAHEDESLTQRYGRRTRERVQQIAREVQGLA